MDPSVFVGPSSPLGHPAPFWFLEFFKVLGFVLHMGPMHLWYAGTVTAMVLSLRSGEARRLSSRLMSQMPVVVALGVNFGIVPLLFTQVAYHKVFYPATILMAWPWIGVVALLTVAYYGVYLYAVGLKGDGARMDGLKRAAGWVSAVLFIAIGFIFANAFSLMTNMRAWAGIWKATSVGGAPLGVALNTADPTLLPRWLMMFGLALTTTAAYTAVDAGLFASGESEGYRAWAASFALKLYAAGALWFAAFGSWYVFGTWRPEIRSMMFSGPLAILTFLTGAGPALPMMFLAWGRRAFTGRLALAVGLAQLAVLALNAVSRQVVQNAELEPFLDVAAEQVKTQWSPLVVFLLLFVAGLAVIAWMLSKVAAAGRDQAPMGA